MSGPTCQRLSLFFFLTNKFKINEKDFKLVKYADDMALVDLLQKTNPFCEAAYLAHIEGVTLTSYMSETKERILCTKPEFNTKRVSRDGQLAETVQNVKYLGTVLDSQVSFSGNIEYVFRKCSQQLYLLRRLSGLGASQQIIELVYPSLVESVLTFRLPAWYGLLSCSNKNKLSRVVSMDSKPQMPQLKERGRKQRVSWQIAPVLSSASWSL